jgi:hypothetical protein
MAGVEVDHLVVAAMNLDEGTDYVFETLGVRPEGGGVHGTMGTHNRLVRLGLSCYLEVIAIDPDAPELARPRWFELDTESMRQRLRRKPQLITWALRTGKMADLYRRSNHILGKMEPMSRGDLHWELTLTEDGRLPGGGVIPFLIDWKNSAHPTSVMAESGCSLVRIRGFHPQPETILPVLETLGASPFIELETLESGPYLTAIVETPGGLREFR